VPETNFGRPFRDVYFSLEKLGNFLNKIPYGALCILVLLLSFAKSGVRGIQPWASLEVIQKFPQLEPGYSQSSIGLLAISHFLGIENKAQYFLLSTLLLVTFILLTVYCFRVYLDSLNAKLAIVLFAFSPLTDVLLGNIGRHDILTISGMLVYVSFKSSNFRFAGLCLAMLGSPEHTCSILLLLLVSSYILKSPSLIRINGISFISSLLLFLVMDRVFLKHLSEDNRFANLLFDQNLQDLAFRNFLYNVPLEIYSYFGPLWIFIIFIFFFLNKYEKIGFASILVVPALANLFIVDKTRDYVIAIVPVIVLFVKEKCAEQWYSISRTLKREHKNVLLSSIFVFMLIFPSLELTFEGAVRSPYEWILKKLIFVDF